MAIATEAAAGGGGGRAEGRRLKMRWQRTVAGHEVAAVVDATTALFTSLVLTVTMQVVILALTTELLGVSAVTGVDQRLQGGARRREPKYVCA